MNTFEHVSPSQISNYLTCKRLWWFQSIFGIKAPQKKSAEIGEAVHKQLENYLLHGTLPDDSDEGQIARAGLGLLPPPGTVQVEIDMSLPENDVGLTLAGIKVTGRIDMVNLRADPPAITDHKSTSDFKWSKTEDELRDDPQMVIYSRYIMRWLEKRGQKVDKVRAGHIVYLTRGKPQVLSPPRSVIFDEANLDSQWAVLDGIVSNMKETAQIKIPGDVPPELSACSKYGGCFFRDKCRALGTFGQVLDLDIFDSAPKKGAVEATVGNALLEKLKNRAAAGAQASESTKPAANKPAEAKPEPSKPPAQEPKPPAAKETPTNGASSGGTTPSALLARLKTRVASTTAGSTGVVPPDAPDPRQDQAILDGLNQQQGQNNAGTEAGATVRRPKNYKLRLKTLGWDDENVVTRMSPQAMHTVLDNEFGPDKGTVDDDGNFVPADGVQIEAASGEPDPNTGTQTTEVTPEVNQTTQTNTTVKAAEPTPARQSTPTDDGGFTIKVPGQTPAQKKAGEWSVPDSWERRKGVAPPVEAAPWQTGLVIYVDAVPEKGHHARNYATLEDVLVPFIAAVEERMGLPSYNLASFNDGPKNVAALVSGNLQDLAKRWPTIVVSTRMPAANAVLEMLLPVAEIVIRGR